MNLILVLSLGELDLTDCFPVYRDQWKIMSDCRPPLQS